MNYTTLKTGDKVAVARSGSWSTHREGIYTVIKANKVKIVVQREHDGYLREFSVARRCEMGATDRYRAAYLESVEVNAARDAHMSREREIRAAWRDIEQATAAKNMVALRAAMAHLETLMTSN